MPLDMVDTCLCMGAGITMAQGFHWTDGDGVCFGFVGDSTFFASGMTGVVNAVYNNADMVLCVLDNSTTAMTGHQPHPGIGRNLMGQIVDKVDIAKVLEGIGVKKAVTVNPLDLDASVSSSMFRNAVKIGLAELPSRSPNSRAVRDSIPFSLTSFSATSTTSSLVNFGFGGICSSFLESTVLNHLFYYITFLLFCQAETPKKKNARRDPHRNEDGARR